MMSHSQIRNKQKIILGAILALALGLRLWGIGFGLPYVGFSIDEWYIADEGLILLRDGFTFSRLNIGTLHGYIQAGVGWLVFSLAGVDPAQVHTYREMLAIESIAGGVIGIPYPAPAYYLWGRIAVAVMSTVSIGLTYLIGREVESAEVGLLGALFLAASPVHAEDSHHIVRTIPALMFLLLACYVILVAYRRGKWWLYGLGSVLAALAILTKQNNVIIVAPLGLVLGLGLWHAARQRSPIEVLQAGGIGVLTVGIGGLTLALALGYRDPATLFSVVLGRIWNYRYVYEGHLFGSSGDNTLLWIFNYFLRDPWRFVFLLALPGAILATVKLRDRGWLLLSIPVPYLFTMSFFTVRILYWLVPVIPFLGILAGVFLTWGQQWAEQRLRHWPVPWHRLMIMGALAITLTSFKLTIVQDYWLSQKDVRVTASEWLPANIPAEAKVVIEQFGPYLSPRTRQVKYLGLVVQNDLETYRAEGVDYLVVNELEYRLVQHEAASPTGDPAAKGYLARYQTVFDRLPLVQEFIGPAMVYPGYWVRVYGMD